MLDERRGTQHGWEPKCDDEARTDRVALLRSMQRVRAPRIPKAVVSAELEALKALVVAMEGELRELRSMRASTSRLEEFRNGLATGRAPRTRTRKLSPGLLARLAERDDGE